MSEILSWAKISYPSQPFPNNNIASEKHIEQLGACLLVAQSLCQIGEEEIVANISDLEVGFKGGAFEIVSRVRIDDITHMNSFEAEISCGDLHDENLTPFTKIFLAILGTMRPTWVPKYD